MRETPIPENWVCYLADNSPEMSCMTGSSCWVASVSEVTTMWCCINFIIVVL